MIGAWLDTNFTVEQVTSHAIFYYPRFPGRCWKLFIRNSRRAELLLPINAVRGMRPLRRVEVALSGGFPVKFPPAAERFVERDIGYHDS